MTDHLEIRNTPYGRFLVPVDPDPPEGMSSGADVDVSTSAHALAPVASEEQGILATLRSAFASLSFRARSPLDERQVRLRAETQEVMDRADAAIESLFADYLQRLDAKDVSPEAPAPPDLEVADVPTP